MNLDSKLTQTLKYFLSAKDVETYTLTSNGGIGLACRWEFNRIDILEKPDKFADIFHEYLKPLADLMKLTQDPLIEQLKKENNELKRLNIEGDRMYDKLENDFEIYKQAIRDSK